MKHEQIVERLTDTAVTLVSQSKIKKIEAVNFIPLGQKFKITIESYDEKKEEIERRTAQQNKYYHKLLDIICDYTGDDHEWMHDNLKVKFLSKPFVTPEKEVWIVSSTTQLTPATFGDYLEKVFKFASEELNLVLPEAKDYY